MQSRDKVKIDVCIVFLVLTWVEVSLRMYVRCVALRRCGWDDAWMCVALVSSEIAC